MVHKTPALEDDRLLLASLEWFDLVVNWNIVVQGSEH